MPSVQVVFVLLVTSLVVQHASAESGARGRALCIGLNEVDSNHYGSPLRLAGCRNDAQDMATIFRGIQGFAAPTVLLDSQATVQAVENEIHTAAHELNAGDLFVLTISSHGSQLPDLNGDEAELDATDRLDETWLLYDRMWIDDERATAFGGNSGREFGFWSSPIRVIPERASETRSPAVVALKSTAFA